MEVTDPLRSLDIQDNDDIFKSTFKVRYMKNTYNNPIKLKILDLPFSSQKYLYMYIYIYVHALFIN